MIEAKSKEYLLTRKSGFVVKTVSHFVYVQLLLGLKTKTNRRKSHNVRSVIFRCSTSKTLSTHLVPPTRAEAHSVRVSQLTGQASNEISGGGGAYAGYVNAGRQIPSTGRRSRYSI